MHDVVGALQIFDARIGQRPQALGGVHRDGRAVFRLGGAGQQGRKLPLAHRQQQILQRIHLVGAVSVGRGAGHKGQRGPAALAAQLPGSRQPHRRSRAGKLQQVQVVPHALPVLPQQGVGVRQVFHDAGVRSPGKNSMHWRSSPLRRPASGLHTAM